MMIDGDNDDDSHDTYYSDSNTEALWRFRSLIA